MKTTFLRWLSLALILVPILEATPIPISPANQQAAHVRRLDAGVVIRSVESFGASNLMASEASFEASGGLLGASWGPRGPGRSRETLKRAACTYLRMTNTHCIARLWPERKQFRLGASALLILSLSLVTAGPPLFPHLDHIVCYI